MQKEYETKYGKIRYIDYNENNSITIVYIHGLGCNGSSDYPEIVNKADHSMAWENPKGLGNALYDAIKNKCSIN